MGITIFTPAPLPLNERERNKAANRSALLTRISDPTLSQIVDDTRNLFNSDWCGIMVINDETQHTIASTGSMLGISQRSTSMSSYAITSPNDVFSILDASIDERFAGNPYVGNGIIRFFAATAILDQVGYAVGVLCIFDKSPRSAFTKEDGVALRKFSQSVSSTLS